MGNKHLISIVIPALNEENNIRPAYDAVVSAFQDLGLSYNFEIIFTDNHSTDGTFQEMAALAEKDRRVKVLRFARNFGFQKSVLTGYRFARGEAAIQMDCDLQDPPELFKDFIELWKRGHDVVVGVRRQREEGRLRTAMRRLFYWFLEAVSDDNVMRDGGDFRLLDRSILDQLGEIEHAQPFVRVLTSSLAARQIGIPYDRQARTRERTKFPALRLAAFAIDGIFSHSTVPLRITTYIGILVFLISIALAIFYLVGYVFFGTEWPSGWTTITTLVLFGIGLNAIFLGILGEYVARIYRQVRPQPTTVVEKSINIP